MEGPVFRWRRGHSREEDGGTMTMSKDLRIRLEEDLQILVEVFSHDWVLHTGLAAVGRKGGVGYLGNLEVGSRDGSCRGRDVLLRMDIQRIQRVLFINNVD